MHRIKLVLELHGPGDGGIFEPPGDFAREAHLKMPMEKKGFVIVNKSAFKQYNAIACYLSLICLFACGGEKKDVDGKDKRLVKAEEIILNDGNEVSLKTSDDETSNTGDNAISKSNNEISSSTGKVVVVKLSRMNAGYIFALNHINIKSLPNNTLDVKLIVPAEVPHIGNTYEFMPTRLKIDKGYIKFISGDHSITLLPNRQCLSKPGKNEAEEGLKVNSNSGNMENSVRFFYSPLSDNKDAIVISLNDVLPEKMEYRRMGSAIPEFYHKYCGLQMPILATNGVKTAYLKIVFSGDFEGEMTGWKYFPQVI